MKKYYIYLLFQFAFSSLLLAQFKVKATGNFETSCKDPQSGQIILKVSGAVAPLTFLWNDNSKDSVKNKLIAGKYEVTVTDGLNKKVVQSYQIKAPKALEYAPDLKWSCSLEHKPASTPPLSGGDYDLILTSKGALRNAQYPIKIIEYDKKTGIEINLPYNRSDSLFIFALTKKNYYKIIDSRQCEIIYDPDLSNWDVSKFTVEITPKFPYPKNYLNVGEEINLSSIISIPIDSLADFGWGVYEFSASHNFDLNFNYCNKCKNLKYIFTDTLQISFGAINKKGCSRSYGIAFYPIIQKTTIENNHYLPNTFSPNDDGINDLLTVYGGKDVDKITFMRIFDHWGNLVFEQKDFLPNDEVFGWNGTYKGIAANQGTYTCTYEVLLKDKTQKNYTKSIQLIR
jgi:gliding motility-associated-like protein